MKTCSRVVNAALCVLFAGVFAGVQAATLKVPLNDGWRFVKADDPAAGTNLTIKTMSGILDKACGAPEFGWAAPAFDDSTWREVAVPHDWGVEKTFDPELPYGDAFLDVTGVGWYRLKFGVENEKCKMKTGEAVAIPPGGLPHPARKRRKRWKLSAVIPIPQKRR